MYLPEKFNKCLYNPLEEISPRLRELLPKKKDEKDLKGVDDKILRYVIALYDPRSPLIKDYPELGSRKIAAARVAGFDLINDAETLELIYECDSDFLVDIIVNYLKLVKNRVWAAIVSDEQTYWEFVRRLLAPITAGDKDNAKDLISATGLKTKLSNDKEEIGDRLENNWNKLIGDDGGLKKKAQIKTTFSPEDMAGV